MAGKKGVCFGQPGIWIFRGRDYTRLKDCNCTAKEKDQTLPKTHKPGELQAHVPAAARVSLAEQAYLDLREEVLNHRLPVGELLNERWLCNRLGYGRTPVHQALLRLHQEELIHIVPRKGVLVRPDSISRILDLLDVRSIIEPVLAARAAERASAEDVASLREITSGKREGYNAAKGAVDRFIERDRAFHAKLAEIGGSGVLIEIQKTLHERAMRFWYSNLWRTLDEGKAADEHAAVIAAIVCGDAQTAAAAMAAHIAEITSRLRKLQSMAPADIQDPLLP